MMTLTQWGLLADIIGVAPTPSLELENNGHTVPPQGVEPGMVADAGWRGVSDWRVWVAVFGNVLKRMINQDGE